MWLIKIGSFLLILSVAVATSETVEKPTDSSVDASENNTEIPGITESVSQASSSSTTQPIPKILNEEVKGPRSRSDTEAETEEVVKLEREALLEKRSIGNIARLLLGGNVPPNHPLVKNPEPKTFNLASNIVASVPGREYGGSGWNTGWNSNALSQLSALLSTKQRLIPHLSQVTSGVTGLAGVKGELFKQIQTISTAAIAQAAADAAAKAVAASAAAQAVTNTVANAVHQTPHAVEDAIKHTNANLLQGWYSNQQNTYASLPGGTAAATQNNNIITPYSQQSQIVNQYRQATVQQPQNSYHSSYSQFQQQQQQQQQAPNNLYSNQPQNNFNNNFNSPASNNNFNSPASNNNFNSPASNNNFNSPLSNNNYNSQGSNNYPQSNNFNPLSSNNFNNAPSYSSTPLIAAPSNLNQAPGSAGVPRNAVPQSNYNSQASSASFNSPSNSFGPPAQSNNAQSYSSASSGNSYNNQQFPPAQNYGGYNSNTNAFNSGSNNNNNYNRNPSVGGAGPGPGYVSGQHSQPAGSHAYPQNGQSYSGPPPGNFNSASGIPGGYPNAHYNPSTPASGNQYQSGNGNGPQNFHNPGPPYNSPETNFNQGPPAPFNAPPSQSSYSGGPNQNFGPQGPPNGFSGYGNSNLNRPFNYDTASSNINNNYNGNNNNNFNRPNNNDNRFNNNDNNNNNNYNGNRPYDNRNNNNNNNNNFNRNTYDNRNNINSNSNNFQGHSRFNNGASRYSSQNQSSRKGGEPNRYYTRQDEDEEGDDLVDKREWSSNSNKHDEKEGHDIASTYDSDREVRHRRVKPVYKESYNPHKHRWTEHPPRRGQIDDRPNFAAHPKSKLGASRRSNNGQRSRGRKPEQPREVYTTLPEYVFRNDRPHRSANESALLIPVSLDEDMPDINVSPNSELDTDLSPSSGSGVIMGSSSSLPATLTISLPSAEDPKIIPAITVFETSFIS